MSDTIETKELYSKYGVTIIGRMVADGSEPNFPEFESSEEEEDFKKHYHNDDFLYVGLIVEVHYDGAEIASDSIWGTEHGYIGEDHDGKPINVDAWDYTPADYDVDKTTGLRIVMMGSTLNGVITEALFNAMKWAKQNGNLAMRRALWAADAWADPNAKEHNFKRTRVGTPGYAALKFEYSLSESGPFEDAYDMFMAVADVLTHIPDAEVPEHWTYRHGPYCDAPENYPATMLADLVSSGDVTTADLITFGDVLTRYLGILEKAGMKPED